jgi:sigma-B regulation protein RsbU (phosphoserine phosphatase)
MDVRQRFEQFADSFTARARGGRGRKPGAQALREDYWQELRDLFTYDLTSKDLQDMLTRDTQDSLRFFVREVDFEALRKRPWHRRYVLTVWRIFQAMAYRLGPARRAFFAVAVLLLAIGWVRYLMALFLGVYSLDLGDVTVVVAGTFLFLVLLLELRDKLTLKGDLEIARQIQFGLLPFEPYDQDGLAIRVAMRPANTVGGDYFDVIDLGGGRLGIVVGDVAGKGMPAALLMALLQASLRTLVTAGLRGEQLIAKLNDHLFANIPSNRLVTLFYAEVDPSRGTVRYVNAGHNPPLLMRADGRIERLPATSIALGVLADAEFTPVETVLADGESLFLYTDGVTEAFNPKDEEYGEARLEAFLAARRATTEGLVDAVVQDVLGFCGAVRPHDDMTLMLVARSSSASESAAGRSS